jgi:hypothetical protein
MISGSLIAESLRPGVPFTPEGIEITKVTRLDVSDSVAPTQPKAWTIIEFTGARADADALARELAACLSPEGGWYADFRAGDDHVVVFADRIFRYRRGDHAVRDEAVSYGRSVGVPAHQLDWPD